jgi:hypothetical protein
MTMATDDSRLSNLEGRIEEQSLGIQDLREGQRQTNVELATGLREVNTRIDQVNVRIERLFLAMLTIGAAQVALMITLIVTILVRT